MKRRESSDWIIISTDRGLCGGLNINLFRETVSALSEWDAKNVEIDVTTIGTKGLGFFKRIGANIVSEATKLGDAPQLTDLIGAMKVMLDAYSDARIDRLYVVHNQFVSAMSQVPCVEQLLPHAMLP